LFCFVIYYTLAVIIKREGFLKPSEIGKKIEDRAVIYLQNIGMEVIDRNFQTKEGEIDVIALDGKTLVFVEVRFRKKNDYGDPAETIDYKKIKRIIKAANRYLSMKNISYSDIRFDVISVSLDSFEHIKNAFDLDYM
jgi:putative endonuclease